MCSPSILGNVIFDFSCWTVQLPQQQNSYDCGLFLLHYVELFLEEVPANFSIYKITSSSKFVSALFSPVSSLQLLFLPYCSIG